MNLFELYATIVLDPSDYEKGLSEAGAKTSSFSDKLKTGLATAAKVGAAAITAASTAVAALTKVSLDQYGEYEQLVGGVETLFKASADVVQQYAANAYKTAGLSANQYMETVTSFSASLLQSLDNDTAAAAEKANVAITDMADLSNKMGTSMESIQNAYQGFAKQNFTMLDNLKLGYGGTKTEMERLLADAEKLSGVKYDISSYADIVDAIHVVQTEMGITGTTALEASSTIQGSISSMKSAWSNLVTGIADENANLDSLIGNFVDSAVTVGENVLPRVEQILGGIGATVSKLAPVISEAVPELVTNVLPSLLDAGVQLIDGLMQGIITALPSLAESAVSIADTLLNTLIEQFPAFLEAAGEVILTLSNGIAGSLPELIPTIVDIVLQIVETLIENADTLVDAAIEIMVALSDGLINSIPSLIEKAPEIIDKLVTEIITNAPKLFIASVEIIEKLAEGIATSIPGLVASASSIVETISDGINQLPQMALTWGVDMIDNFINGVKARIGALVNTISNVAQTVRNFIGFSEPKEGPLSNFHTYAPDMMDLFSKGIKENAWKLNSAFYESIDFGTASMDVSMSRLSSPYSVAGVNNAYQPSGFGPINITINGSDFDSLHEMAVSLMDEIQGEYERRNSAIGRT